MTPYSLSFYFCTSSILSLLSEKNTELKYSFRILHICCSCSICMFSEFTSGPTLETLDLDLLLHISAIALFWYFLYDLYNLHVNYFLEISSNKNILTFNPLDVELIEPSVECAAPVYRLTASKWLTFIKKLKWRIYNIFAFLCIFDGFLNFGGCFLWKAYQTMSPCQNFPTGQPAKLGKY